jgi:uncharacterized protein involved in tolerance to divalent cations
MVDRLTVTTTAPDRESAAHLAASAVGAKLAAAAHSSVTSIFSSSEAQHVVVSSPVASPTNRSVSDACFA